MDKKQFRTFIRQKRQTLSLDEQQQASKQLLVQFLKTNLHQSCQHVALYVAHRGEMDVTPISDFLFQQQKSCYLPVLPNDASRVMHFVKFQQQETLIPNQYGILEPKTRHEVIEPNQLDLVFVPLLAVSKTGLRLGAGGGYFDATFTFKHGKQLSKPLLIGVGYQWQQFDDIPTDAWDLKLDGFLTDQHFYQF